ncbi:PAS domain S-box protein, partial [bacterium]|nr:PAS domain S-box protein [bacterium]
MEYRVVWSDGTVRTVWAEAGELVLNDKGQAEVLTGIVQDITERKQAEDQLQESERKLKLFVEYAPAAIAMFDRDMKYIAASRRFLADYNLKDENIIGRSHYEIFPEISERWKEIHRRCLAGAIEKEEEDPFPRMDGTLDWVRWEIHPWNDRSGEIGGIILFSEVITERKLAEKQVQLQLQRMSALREIDRAISSSLDMRLSLDVLLNQVLSQLGVDAAAVLLLNPSSQTLEYEAGKGFRSLAIHAGWIGTQSSSHPRPWRNGQPIPPQRFAQRREICGILWHSPDRERHAQGCAGNLPPHPARPRPGVAKLFG